MCVPNKQDRAQQQNTAAPTTPPQNTVNSCPDEKHILVRLEVKGAVQESATSFWEVQNDNLTISVKAITSPNTPGVWQEIEWNTGGVNADCNIVEVSRAGPMEVRVAARLNGPWKYVDIKIYDLLALTCPLPLKLNDRDRHWKAYEKNTTTTVTATTVPDEASVWSLLVWNQAAKTNQSDVSLAAAGDPQVTVSLGQTVPKQLAADIHICKWPKLEINQLSFDTYPVFNDGATEIGKEFDGGWKEGRPDPATNVATASCQSPLCYASEATISLGAQFKVTQAPTEKETVDVKGTAVVGGTTIVWKGQVDVDPKSTYVSIGATAGDKPLPKGVACYDPMEIKWSMMEADQKTWTAIGSSKHLLYVLLGAPQKPLYWTLLDISCVAAAGKIDEVGFVPAAFVPFTTHTGDGKGFKRKGDGIELSYYKQGVATEGAKGKPSVYSTLGILSRPDGTGRCGGWANLLLHMFEMHGVTSARKLVLIRVEDESKSDMELRFLVKTCTFTGSGTEAAPYPYVGNTDCKKKENVVAGQGKNNPQFDFGDHVVVEHGGKIYDPSYGVGPKSSQLEYEQAAIDGLGTMKLGAGYFEFVQADGTKQFISAQCSPGFVEHQVTGGETLAAIASKFGTTESAIFDHEYNQALKAVCGTADQIKDGDVVYIPRGPNVQMLYGHYK